jgi:8-oxo-dGTP diphosphatase
VTVDYLEQLYTFTKVDRDPRGRTITIAYYALVNPAKFEIAADTDASHVQWVPVEEALKLKLGFDHNSILEYALTRLRNKIKYEPIGFDLLPEKFKLSDLHKLYETILNVNLDLGNFYKKIQSYKILTQTKEVSKAPGVGRKGRLYQFDKKTYEKMKKSGFLFELQK